MRDVRIRKQSVVVFFIVFTYFAGNYAGFISGLGSFLKIVGNIAFIYMLLDVLYNIIKNRNFSSYSGIALFFSIFMILYLVICIINKNGEGYLSYVKSIIMMLWIDKTISLDKSQLADSIRLAFYCWCIIDSIFTILHPEGVHFLVGGEYILGGKNNKLFYMFIAQVLSMYKYYTLKYKEKRNLFLIEWFAFTLLCIININIIKSSTTMIIIVLIAIYPLLNGIIKRSFLTSPTFVCIFHIGVFVILIFVREVFQDQLDYLMKVLFDKDASFTGRIYIWRAALVEISNNILIGMGRYNDIPAVLKSGNIFMWSMSHNQILEVLLRGGMVLLTVWISTIGVLIKNFRKFKGRQMCAFATYALFTVLFFFHTEASIEKIAFFALMVLYHITGEVSYMEDLENETTE